MKDYIEMTEDVLCRSKNIIKKKKRAVRAAASSVLCLCLVAVMGAGVWMTGVRRNDPQIPEETIAATDPAVTGDAVPRKASRKALKNRIHPPPKYPPPPMTPSFSLQLMSHGCCGQMRHPRKDQRATRLPTPIVREMGNCLRKAL